MRGRAKAVNRISPALITLVALTIYLGAVFLRSGKDPYAFIRIGSQFQVEHAVDEQGYDGQFVYYIARDPNPERVSPFLDVPAYRYQRILLPLLARFFSFGNPDWIPPVLIYIGVSAQLAAVLVLGHLLAGDRLERVYALVYGLFPGALLSVRLALPEPLAYFFVLLGFAVPHNRRRWKWLLFSLAVFTKETSLLFVAAQLLVYFHRRDRPGFLGLAAVSLLPYGLFQGWLFLRFGAPGIGSGGAMATGFEWIPFMGLLRIGAYGPLPLLAFGLVIVPFVYFPSVWGLARTAGSMLLPGLDLRASALFFHAAVIPFLPFSTVREPGGLLRFSCGLVLAVLLFAASRSDRRALNYSVLWIVLNAILLNEVR